MSSPKNRTTKLFKLERTSSGVFRRRPSSGGQDPPSDTSKSRRSSDSIVSERVYLPDANNELSKNISATVKLKPARPELPPNKPVSSSTVPVAPMAFDVFRSKPDLLPAALYQRPAVTRTTSPLSRTFTRRSDASSMYSQQTFESSPVTPTSPHLDPDEQYYIFKLISNFELFELLMLIYKFFIGLSLKFLLLIKSSRYVSSEQNGKVHFHSFVYGLITGALLVSSKRIFIRMVNYMASMALQVSLCIAVISFISLSFSRRSHSAAAAAATATATTVNTTTKPPMTLTSSSAASLAKRSPAQAKTFDARDYYRRQQQPLDPVKSSQIPLVNPIHPKRADSLPIHVRPEEMRSSSLHPLYKQPNFSDAFISLSLKSRNRIRGSKVQDDVGGNFDHEEDEYLEEEEEVLDDDMKSLFSVLTAANSAVPNSKKNYKSFIEQTKKLKNTSKA